MDETEWFKLEVDEPPQKPSVLRDRNEVLLDSVLVNGLSIELHHTDSLRFILPLCFRCLQHTMEFTELN